MSAGGTRWVVLARRTSDPKLAWLERKLAARAIISRRNGHSFHAPILEVRARDLSAAMRLLRPVDDLPDDDPRFGGADTAQ